MESSSESSKSCPSSNNESGRSSCDKSGEQTEPPRRRSPKSKRSKKKDIAKAKSQLSSKSHKSMKAPGNSLAKNTKFSTVTGKTKGRSPPTSREARKRSPQPCTSSGTKKKKAEK